MKAAIYIRVSTEEQRERQTIETQRQFAKQYCRLHEIDVAGVYADDGVTGTLPLSQRPAGSKLLKDANARKFDTVLFYKLDRLGRDPRLTLNAVNELESCGVTVKSMTEPFDTGDATGRFLMSILASVAGLERETFLERSQAGRDRLARQGAWLGGIVPFGYRVKGKKKDARLVISEEPLPGVPLSEADVVGMVFQLAAKEGWSCAAIVRHLTTLCVPPSYAKDGRKVAARGKRKQATAGVWWAGRIRCMIVNPTYKGIHRYGRRSKRGREAIERRVPAIVSEEIWEKAQKTLQKNRAQCKRNARRRYLLRGIMKCGICGLTYCGLNDHGMNVSYQCRGKGKERRFYRERGGPCPSRRISADIEDVVWADIVDFLRNPGQVIEALAQKMEGLEDDDSARRRELELIENQLAEKDAERERILTLYRKGTIDAKLLDRQMADIETERRNLTEAREAARERLGGVQAASSRIDSAEALLRELNGRLDGAVTWEVKRELVETLVEGIRVDTVRKGRSKQAIVHVTYCFDSPHSRIANSTHSRGVLNTGIRIGRSYGYGSGSPTAMTRMLVPR